MRTRDLCLENTLSIASQKKYNYKKTRLVSRFSCNNRIRLSTRGIAAVIITFVMFFPFKKLQKIDQFLSGHFGLLCILLSLILLRIPNFFEPYWYGDEAIYLTIGNAMRHGERLYSEIIDHKTPIIYYLAMVPNQLWFRVLNLFMMIVTTILFYFFAQKLFVKHWIVNFITFVFMILTTVPWFEG